MYGALALSYITASIPAGVVELVDAPDSKFSAKSPRAL